MHVCFDIRKVELRAFEKPVVTLGTFDGVHLGHQAIINILLERAQKRKTKGVLVTYEPHPQSVVSPADAPGILTTLEEKLVLLEKLGVEETLVMNFDRQLREFSAQEFMEKILLEKLDVGHLVVGDDHAFGKGRTGRIQLLKDAASRYKFDLEVVVSSCIDGARISSTRIRKELREGDFTKAKSLLGHGYPISGNIVPGKGRGRELDYPTLNLEVADEKLLPKDGVYSVTAQLEGKSYTGMMYIGPKLTFGEHDRSIEVHLFDLEAPPGESEMRVYAEDWVRAPRTFADPQELKDQLKSDEKKIKDMFEVND